MKQSLNERNVNSSTSHSSEIEETYLSGRLHSFNDEPSQVNKKFGEQIWHQKGKKHREGDKPAYVKYYEYEEKYQDAVVTVEKRMWFRDGKLHRENNKPAVIDKTLTIKSDAIIVSVKKKWFNDGELHNSIDQPAIIEKKKIFSTAYILRKLEVNKTFMQNNAIHREGDKPANLISIKDYNMDGFLRTKFIHKEYVIQGVVHRNDDKPALKQTTIAYDLVNGTSFKKNITKQYLKNGNLHRDGDKPAEVEIQRDRAGNVSLRSKVYAKEGLAHRDNNKPAYLFYAYNTDGVGDNRIIKYYVNGNLHREGDKPAFILNYPNDDAYFYFQEGMLHREHEPAIWVCFEDTIYFSFYKQGSQVAIQDSQVLKTELEKADPSFKNMNISSYPTNQIVSILNSVQDKISYDIKVPITYYNDAFEKPYKLIGF